MAELVYLDYNATTPVADDVLEQMLPWMSSQFWNASSAHAGGRVASTAVDRARASVASLVGASPREIVWTSGSTEANNLALKGTMARAASGARVLVAQTEHKAVIDTAHALEDLGFKVDELPVGRDGLLDLASYEAALDEDVALVSVMLANNETGIIQPLRRISDLAHQHGATVHTDATQAVGRIPVDVRDLDVDLASLSAHKFYGPKGIGCLFVRRGVKLEAQVHGGGHESGLRSGTTNVPGVVGMGAAADLAAIRLENDGVAARELLARLVEGLTEGLDGVEVIAAGAPRLPNTLNIRFVGADADAVMVNAPDILISSGSACTSRIPNASHVLQAMSLSQDQAYECLRFSVGRGTTAQEIDKAVEQVTVAVRRVRLLNQDPQGETE
jgi:cysteine desulfurase